MPEKNNGSKQNRHHPFAHTINTGFDPTTRDRFVPDLRRPIDGSCKVADDDGKTVIVAGLDGDYLRRSFGAVIDIIPLADSVTKLTARCEVCGQKAFFTLRKTGDTRTELIGGADVYMPVCRKHYVNNQVVVIPSKEVLDSDKASGESCVETVASII